MHAHLIGEDLVTFIIDYAAAITVAVEAEPDIRARGAQFFADRMQHPQIFGVGIVFGESPIELRCPWR